MKYSLEFDLLMANISKVFNRYQNGGWFNMRDNLIVASFINLDESSICQ